jgi:hypothetical protein
MTHPFWGSGYKDTRRPIKTAEDQRFICRYKDGTGEWQYKEFKTHAAAKEFQKKHSASAKVYKKR